MRVVHIDVAPELRPILHLGVLTFTGLSNGRHESRLNQPLMEAAAAVRAHRPPSGSRSARCIAGPASIRRGTGPRPRRCFAACAGAIRFRASTRLVDVCNWCSLEFQLPYGLYDLSRVEGAVTLRLGNEGESYPGIRKDEVHVGGPHHARRRSGTLRQSVFGLGPDDGDERDDECARRGVRADRRERRAPAPRALGVVHARPRVSAAVPSRSAAVV